MVGEINQPISPGKRLSLSVRYIGKNDYDSRLSLTHKLIIKTAVIYTGEIEEAPHIVPYGSITYEVENVFMKNYDGDQKYEEIKQKIENEETLTDEDYLNLIFLPLMKSRQSGEEQALKAAELVKSKAGLEKDSKYIIAALVVITDKFMSLNNKKKLLEVLKLTEIEQWLREEIREEEREEGREEGREEERKVIAISSIKEGMDVDTVVRITGLTKDTVLKLKNENKVIH